MLGPIRLLLAALVLLTHTAGYPQGWPDLGLVAVMAFFAISGYLMPAAFERNYAGASFVRRSWRYALNRALRIFPLYWVVLALAIYLHADAGHPAFDHALDHPQVFAQNILLLGLNQAEVWGHEIHFIGPAWTLDIELQYYVLIPFLVFAYRRWRTATSFGMLLAAAVSVVLAARPTGIKGIDHSLIVWLPLFEIGFICHASRFSFAA
jgi:peptidoglycan/LPS O-acetylase OafA/YrhL